MARMGQLFPYFGSKKRLAGKYPRPGGVVIEPFCGAAGYSAHWMPEKVLLSDVDENVVRCIRFIIEAGKRGGDPIRDLPILDPGDCVPQDLDGGECLIGFWCVRGVESPRKKLPNSKWVNQYPTRFWGEYQRERLAADSVKIKEWEVEHGDYKTFDGIDGTWFIDPPYYFAGKHYNHPFSEYGELAEFSRRQGSEVIVCEEAPDKTPDWMEFRELFTHTTTHKRKATEVVWTKGIVDGLF